MTSLAKKPAGGDESRRSLAKKVISGAKCWTKRAPTVTIAK